MKALALAAVLPLSFALPALAQDDQSDGQPPEYVQPAPEDLGQAQPAEPVDTPPQPPPTMQAPPPQPGMAAPPVVATPPATNGQWVFSTDYGWVWAPAGEGFTYYPPSGYPYTYVYEPGYGWNWIVAPWVFGGYWPYYYVPYTGPFLGRYGWYHGAWGWYHPWGYYHGYGVYYGPAWRSNIVAFRAAHPYAWRGVYRGGVYYGGYYRRPEFYRAAPAWRRGGVEYRGAYRGGVEYRGGVRPNEYRGGVRPNEYRGGVRPAPARPGVAPVYRRPEQREVRPAQRAAPVRRR